MIYTQCRHRGSGHGGRHFCRSDKAERDRRWLAVCDGCPVADIPNRAYDPPDVSLAETDRPDVSMFPQTFDTSFPECRHRGVKIEDKEADLCGLKGMVFEVMACNCERVESGRCVATRICGRQTEVACSTCDKREP